jgi:hypothetical protein
MAGKYILMAKIHLTIPWSPKLALSGRRSPKLALSGKKESKARFVGRSPKLALSGKRGGRGEERNDRLTKESPEPN